MLKRVSTYLIYQTVPNVALYVLHNIHQCADPFFLFRENVYHIIEFALESCYVSIEPKFHLDAQLQQSNLGH